MLKHMGLPLFASDIEKALNLVFREGKVKDSIFANNK